VNTARAIWFFRLTQRGIETSLDTALKRAVGSRFGQIIQHHVRFVDLNGSVRSWLLSRTVFWEITPVKSLHASGGTLTRQHSVICGTR